MDQALLLGACGTHTEENNSNHPTATTTNAATTFSTKSNNSKVPTTIMSSTTTRIAKGKRRCVTRTAHVHPDGTREVVVEEDGVVKLRKFYPSSSSSGAAAATTATNGGKCDDDSEKVGSGDMTDQCTEKAKRAQPQSQQYDNIHNTNAAAPSKSETKDCEDDGGADGGGVGGIQKEGKFTFLGLFKSCLAPACTCLPNTTTTTTTPTAATTNTAN